MRRFKVFISSVQSEFAKERKALAAYLHEDTLLSDFFTPFIFEEVPANNKTPGKVFIDEVKSSDIYIGLLGKDYGFEDGEGVSPTEREYDLAKEHNVQRWVYLKDMATKRHPKEETFIRKIEQDVSRKMFHDIDALKNAVYRSAILFLKQNGKIESHDFDESLNAAAVIEDINVSKIAEFVKQARYKRNFPLKETASVEEVLKHLRLIRNGKFVNSALLAFSTDPQKVFPTATVKCAHFHGLTVQKPIPDFKEFGGTVYEMATNAIDFVLSKISISTGTREKSNRVETVYEVPRAVIAEAVINAVAHREYYSKGSIQISVFKDRIEVLNPGKLPAELELEDLKKPHGSYPYNPLLANCLFLTGDIERYGTGTLEIFKLTKEKGLRPPVFSLDEGFKVIIWRPSARREQVGVQVGVQAEEQVGEQVAANDIKYMDIENLAHRIVWVLKNEMSRNEIMEILSLSGRRNFVEKYLNPALNNKYIEMTNPDSPKSPKQKYRLTDKGKILKKRLKNDNK